MCNSTAFANCGDFAFVLAEGKLCVGLREAARTSISRRPTRVSFRAVVAGATPWQRSPAAYPEEHPSPPFNDPSQPARRGCSLPGRAFTTSGGSRIGVTRGHSGRASRGQEYPQKTTVPTG